MRAVVPMPLDGAAPVVFGADQPQYEPLPAMVDPTGVVMTEWEFSAEDLAKIVAGGRLRLWTHTFQRPFQPVALEIVE